MATYTKKFTYEQIASAYQSRFKAHAETDREICGPCPVCNDGEDRFHIGRGDTQVLIGCRKCPPKQDVKVWLIALGLIDSTAPRQRSRAKTADNLEPMESAPEPEAEAEAKPKHQPKPYIPPKRAERWDYCDTAGVHRCSAFRWTVHKRDGTARKEIKQAAPDGAGGFLTRSMPPVRPLLYSPDLAKTASHTSILLVEGEKCADFAREQGQVATTWIGGTAVVERADFGVLAGRPVTLWPDNDAPGREAMDKAARRLIALGCKISLIAPPADAPEKFDCADCAPDEFARLIEQAAPYEPPAEEEAPVRGLSKDSRGLASVCEIEGWGLRYNTRGEREEIDLGDSDGWRACSPRLDLVLRERVALNHRGGKDGNEPLNFSADGWAKARSYLCDESRVDPVREWLDSLPPKTPGHHILNAFGRCFKHRSDEYSIWLIEALWLGTVERIMEPGCPQRVMPVIVGNQDTGKSSFVRHMLPPHLQEEHFQPRLPLSDDPKEKVHKTVGVVLAECGELSGKNKVSVEDLKAHLDLSFDRERLAYAHHAKAIKRGYFTIGTANRGDTLPEDDSNSRFGVVDVEEGEEKPHEVLPQVRAACWRQALEMYRRGERRGHLPDKLKPIQRERNQRYDKVDEVLLGKLKELAPYKGWATMDAIIQALNVEARPCDMGRLLRREGYKDDTPDFPLIGRRRAWLHPQGDPRTLRYLKTIDWREQP